MQHITELARRLGKAIAESPEAARLNEARKAMKAEEGLDKMFADYQAQAEKIDTLTQQNKPVEVEDKHTLRELQEKLFASQAFKDFTAAQVEYVDLMRKVNDELRKALPENQQAD